MKSKLQELRTITRKNSKSILERIIHSHVVRKTATDKDSNREFCMFCGSENNLSKEHVVPRWLFDKSTQAFFTTDINGLNQTYNKTTIPACRSCNSDLLNTLEKYIQELLASADLETSFFQNDELENIIRWLEIIDYKFQVLNVRRKFIKSSEGKFIPFLADFPLSIMSKNIEYSPKKTVAQIRGSLKRVTTKSKALNVNSLVVFKTSNLCFYFFHTMDDFVFIEIPKYKMAFFYFYKSVFDNVEDARDAAQEIIQKVYQ